MSQILQKPQKRKVQVKNIRASSSSVLSLCLAQLQGNGKITFVYNSFMTFMLLRLGSVLASAI